IGTVYLICHLIYLIYHFIHIDAWVAFLAENQETEKNIQNKLAYARDLSQNAGGVSEEIEFAVGKLKAVLRHKLVLKQLSVEKAQRIAFILNEAVEKIEAINEALISEVREDE
nr:hypothetical protein [Proteus mirabilis]